jgi:hypothetical protein
LTAAASLAAQGTVLGSFLIPNGPSILPVGLAHNGSGNFLLTEITSDQLFVMTPTGTILNTFSITANSGNPIGVTTNGTNVFVTDTAGPLVGVDVYDMSGNYVRNFPTASTFPEGIAFNPNNNHLYVVDGTASQIHEYDLNGAQIAVFPLQGTSIDGCAYDSGSNSFWIYDSGTDMVRRYDTSFNQTFSFPGTNAAGFGLGEGCAFLNGVVYVVASGQDRVVMFAASGNAASASPYGLGCPTAPAVYELFSAGTMDLSNRSFFFQRNGSSYSVSNCTSNCWESNLGTNLGLTDDSVSPPQNLGFSFQIPGGGTTNAVEVSSNGYIWLEVGLGGGNGCCNGTVSTFLSLAARIAPMWHDLNPSAGGTVNFNALPGKAVITWDQVPEFGSGGSNTMQVQLFSDGSFQISYQNVANLSHTGLVGFTRGNGVPDPGAIDWSTAVPFSAGPFGLPLTLAATTRPVLNTNFNLVTTNIPAGAVAGVVIMGSTQQNIPLAGFGMPGCSLYHTADLPTLPINLGNGQTSLPVPNNVNIVGAVLFFESAVIAPGINPAGAVASNGIRGQVGSV